MWLNAFATKLGISPRILATRDCFEITGKKIKRRKGTCFPMPDSVIKEGISPEF
jgi:hypothetical protein